MECFEYNPIDLEGRSFRLIQLRKAEYGPVQCDLFDAWLDDENGIVEYEALSYTWEGTYKPHEIEVNGKIMPVTKNLSLALRSLRYHHQDRILWIDAICIDQNNDKERGHQVLQMASIYKKAEQVVIWLGQATQETDLVFQQMSQFERQAVRRVCKDWKVRDERWLDIWHSLLPLPDNNRSQRVSRRQQQEGLEDLLSRSWFDRVWIIQEVANARAAKVTCGAKSVSARIFAIFPSLLQMEPSSHCQAILDVMPGPTRQYSWWTKSQDLYTLLLKFRGSEASDPRDKIYALLGISSDGSTTDMLSPDYEKSEVEAVQDTVAFLLHFHNELFGTSRPLNWTLIEFLQSLEQLGNKVCLWAAGEGNEVIFKLLLNTGRADINFQNKHGQTPLLLAAKNGHETIVELLLDSDVVDANLQDKNGSTALLLAAENGYETIVKLLLNKGGIDINVKNKNGQTSLLLAAENGHENVSKLILKTGAADDELKDNHGWVPLWVAAINSHEVIVEMLLDYRLMKADDLATAHKAALETDKVLAKKLIETHEDTRNPRRSRKGQTPLWWAILNGHTTLVELFLETGNVEVFSRNDSEETLFWWTARHGHESAFKLMLKALRVNLVDNSENRWAWHLSFWASKNGHENILKLMLDTGRANIFFQNRYGQELIAVAASYGQEAVVKLLLNSKFSDHWGRGEAFWFAALHGHEPILSMLLDAGADVNFVLQNRETALWCAAWNGHTAVAKFLLCVPNIEVDRKDDAFEQTPLSLAAEFGHMAIVKLLLKTNSVDVCSKDKNGQTPLALAMQGGYKEIVNLLEEYIRSR